MGTKAHPWAPGGRLQFYDPALGHERIRIMAPVQFYDDFLGAWTVIPPGGAEESGCLWSKKIVAAAGAAAVAGVADAANGVIACSLDVTTNEKEDAALYMGDQRQFDLTTGLIFECRLQMTVTPTLLAEASWGLIDDWSDGLIDSATYQVCFNADGETAVHAQMDDNVATDLDVDTGVVAGTATWRIYRIDCTDVTNVKFYIDGNRVASGTTFAYATIGANAILQPYFGLYKSTGFGEGTIQIDYVRIWQNRS